MTYQEQLDEIRKIRRHGLRQLADDKCFALCQKLIDENARLCKRDEVVVQWLDMDMGLRFGGWLKDGLALIDVEQDRVDYLAAPDEQKEK